MMSFRSLRAAILPFLALALLLSSCATVERTADPAGQHTDGEARGKLLFWKVESPTATVWLLGTVHLGKPDMYPLPSPVERAIEASRAVFTELSPEELARIQGVMAADMGSFLMEGGKKGTDGLSPEALAKFEALIPDEATRRTIAGFKPWFLSYYLAMSSYQQAGFDGSSGVDMYVMERAKSLGKRVIGVETVEFQYNLMKMPATMSLDEQWKSLDEMLMTWDTTVQDTKDLFAAYEAGNELALDRVIRKDLDPGDPFSAAFFRATFTDRNVTMKVRIEEALEQDGIWFFAFGAGHFVGKDGIVDLLGRDGWKTEQIKGNR